MIGLMAHVEEMVHLLSFRHQQYCYSFAVILAQGISSTRPGAFQLQHSFCEQVRFWKSPWMFQYSNLLKSGLSGSFKKATWCKCTHNFITFAVFSWWRSFWKNWFARTMSLRTLLRNVWRICHLLRFAGLVATCYLETLGSPKTIFRLLFQVRHLRENYQAIF